MRSAARIASGFAAGMRKIATRRPLSMAGFFMAIALLGIACNDQQLPTDVKKPAIVRHNVSPGEGAVIATDKADYAPGQTVMIDGWGWTAGENVRLQITHPEDIGDSDKPSHQPWIVVADGNGYVESSWLVEEDEGGTTLKLTADGELSAAHAELIFTDLVGTVALYADASRTISQNAYPWGATVYPRLTSGGANNCYQIQWKDPSSVVQQTNTFGAGSTSYNPPSFTIPATGPSGVWSVVVSQNAAANCSGPFTGASDPINFDVARAIVIGAGTTADDATGGDQCVPQINAPPGGCGALSTSIWTRTQSSDNVRTFIRFDLSTAVPAAVPAGATIDAAKVRLTVIGTPGTQRTLEMQRAAATWDEGTVTWANQPAVAGSAINATALTTLTAGAGGGDPQTWVKWTVTADLQGFLDGTFTNYGWRIKDATENGSLNTVRFASTENVCTPGTTCNRVKPILLLDYTPGPTKLAFTNTAFTGRVGDCLGPMAVQSQDDLSSALAVTANTTVSLTSDNGGTGAGAFYSNSSCTTGITSVQINSGSYDSPDFYYRATGRGDGTHEITADDTNPNRLTSATQIETINKALTTLVYTGDRLVLVGNTFTFSAVLSSDFEPCTENKHVILRLMPSPLNNSDAFYDAPAPTNTNSSGVVTKSVSTTGWIEGIYDGRANFTGDNDCEASKDSYAVSILEPGGAATGGGFLAGSKVGGGRANFGFTVRQIEGSNPIAYKGQFLLIKQDGGVPSFRCKGNIDTYGSVPSTSPQKYAASGTCDFQLWDPALDGGNGDWYVPAGPGYDNQTFTIYFIDNGSGKGKTAPPPDEFGFTIGFVGGSGNPSFAIAPINGGNIDVKSSTTTTTSTGGGRKK